MEYKVRFRVNKRTGQVELFEVDHEGPQTLDDAEHNRRHEQLAADIGRQVQRDPRIIEMHEGVSSGPEAESERAAETDVQTRTEQNRETE